MAGKPSLRIWHVDAGKMPAPLDTCRYPNARIDQCVGDT